MRSNPFVKKFMAKVNCGKRLYLTVAEAREAIRSHEDNFHCKKAIPYIRYYWCWKCHGYHLTSMDTSMEWRRKA